MASLTSAELELKLKKRAKLSSIVFKDPYLESIISFCRLKPKNAKTTSSISKTELCDTWIDEFGSSIRITKKEKTIKLNDLSVDKSKIINTDLYSKLSIEKISKISNIIFLFCGKEEDFKTDHFVLSFLGIDGILRTYCFIYEEWFSIPPLALGYSALRLIAKNKSCEDIKIFKNNKVLVYPCKKQISFLSYWPNNPDMNKIIDNFGVKF